ncbi:MAG: hypothetical protein ACW967_09385 [Candidatus Hodarchaeales archaeon]|jgi:hypothetical protein
MKIEKVKISLGRKVSHLSEDMNSIDLTLEAKLGETDDPLEIFLELKEKIQKELEKWEEELKSKQFPLQKEKSEDLLCPTCNEVMKAVSGKNYFLCSKHYGYPEQIKKGEVKERKF